MNTNTNTIDAEALLRQAADISNALYAAWKVTDRQSAEWSAAYENAQKLYDSIAYAILAK